MAGNEMCYLGEMLGGLQACFHPNLCTAEQFQCSATVGPAKEQCARGVMSKRGERVREAERKDK